MRKVLSLVLVLVLVLGGVPFGFTEVTEDMTAGEKLKELGLLIGDESGDLMEDKTLTRAEMMVVLSRYNKVEDEAKSFSLTSSFDDVEGHWAESYIEYGYLQGWTIGVSTNLFAPESTVTEQMVATFMLRLLGYEDNWDTAIEDAEALGIMNDNPVGEFTRGQAFDMMWDTLMTPMKGSTIPFGVEKGFMEPFVVDVEIDSATAVNNMVVEVELDEDMDAPEAIDASVLKVMDDDDEELAIDKVIFAPWDPDNYTLLVWLDDELIGGELYSIESGDTSANFGGLDEDEFEPTVDDVYSDDYNKVVVEFNEPVLLDDLEMEIAEKYGDEDELAILDWEYDGSDTIVLTTEEQQGATLYNLNISGAVDLAGNEMDEDDQTFSGTEMDTDDQEVVDAVAYDSMTVDVEFRTKVDLEEGLNPANYTITEKYGDEDEVAVVDAELKLDDDDDAIENIVRLTLGDHTQGATLYELEVEDVGTLYGYPLDSDNDTVTFTGIEEDTDEPDGISVEAISNTEIEVTIDDDSDVSEDVDLDLFSIAEKYGDEDKLAVLSIKEVKDKTITLITESQSGATLYELTVEEGLADKWGNETTDELDATFTGLDVADEIDSITATNKENGKTVYVKFNENYGDGAMDIANYFIDGGIGYPTKVEEVEDDDDNIIKDEIKLTVKELDKGDIYELTVKNIDNADGVAMDKDGVSDKFSAIYGEAAADVSLEGVVAIDNQTLKLYFNDNVEDIDELVDGNDELFGDALEYRAEGNSTWIPLEGYAYEDPNNSEVLIVTVTKNDAFVNDDGDEFDLRVNSTDMDPDEDQLKFAENTDEPDEIQVEGIVALDSRTLRVYFNQSVRGIKFAEGTESDDFAFVDLDGDENLETADLKFMNAYSENDAEDQWIFILDENMTDDMDDKLDFVVQNIEGITTHTFDTDLDFQNDSNDSIGYETVVLFDNDSDEQVIQFAINTDVEDYIDNIGVVMLDAQTVKVYFPEDMNTTEPTTDSVISVLDWEAYDFAVDDSNSADDPTNADENNMTYFMWNDSDNSVEIKFDKPFGTTDGSKLYLGFADTLENKAGTKVVEDEDGDQVWKEFSVSTKDIEEMNVSDVAADSGNDKIVITLDQPLFTGTGTLTTTGSLIGNGIEDYKYDNFEDFLDDFTITVDEEDLVAGDVDSVEFELKDDDDDTDFARYDGLYKNAYDHVDITITLSDANLLIEDQTIEVMTSDSTSNVLESRYTKAPLAEESDAVDVIKADTVAPEVLTSDVEILDSEVTSHDLDGNGVVETIAILFDEYVDDSTFDKSKFVSTPSSFTVDGLQDESFLKDALDDKYVVTDDNILFVKISNETYNSTTDSSLTTDEITDELKILAEGIKDLSGNSIAEVTKAIVDQAKPVVDSYSINTTTASITFSENVTTDGVYTIYYDNDTTTTEATSVTIGTSPNIIDIEWTESGTTLESISIEGVKDLQDNIIKEGTVIEPSVGE